MHAGKGCRGMLLPRVEAMRSPQAESLRHPRAWECAAWAVAGDPASTGVAARMEVHPRPTARLGGEGGEGRDSGRGLPAWARRARLRASGRDAETSLAYR